MKFFGKNLDTCKTLILYYYKYVFTLHVFNYALKFRNVSFAGSKILINQN